MKPRLGISRPGFSTSFFKNDERISVMIINKNHTDTVQRFCSSTTIRSFYNSTRRFFFVDYLYTFLATPGSIWNKIIIQTNNSMTHSQVIS